MSDICNVDKHAICFYPLPGANFMVDNLEEWTSKYTNKRQHADNPKKTTRGHYLCTPGMYYYWWTYYTCIYFWATIYICA